MSTNGSSRKGNSSRQTTASQSHKVASGRTRKPVQHAPRKTARSHQKKKVRKSGGAQFMRYVPSWPKWVGAIIVVLTCWLLFHFLLNKPSRTAFAPPKGYTVHGIDISHHQGIVDWELLRNQGIIDDCPISFVFMKATEGSDIVDSQFSRNFEAARSQGIMRGAYHFYRTSTSAKQQAQHFISHVRLEEGDLPPVLDVEVKPADVSDEDFRQGILEWLLRVEQHYRVKPILYTYHAFRQQYMNDSIFNLYPYWIAHYYVDTLRYRGPWAFWQHSDKGQLPGISEKVDLDVFRGTYDELLRMTIGQANRQ